jgi:hypothetical protein
VYSDTVNIRTLMHRLNNPTQPNARRQPAIVADRVPPGAETIERVSFVATFEYHASSTC